MPMIVANNLNALSTQRNLNTNNHALSKSLERLSSGFKINAGSDDPSGLVISEQLRAQNVGLERAVQNTQEANNVLGIAEGALNEMNNILKKMRQLAIHSANSGVTSPEQVAADQAEVDSSVQTLDRIARTTKYSDQFLLNGNKRLGFDSDVQITDANDHQLLDLDLTDIRQIFKRDNFSLSINFSGSGEDGTSVIDNGNEAQKGYFEISKSESAATQVTTGKTGTDKHLNYTLSSDQSFTLSGNLGSRTMSFAKGTHLGEMATSINSVVDSTGVKATLVFDSSATVVETASNATQDISLTASHASGSADVFNRSSLGEITTSGITSIAVTDNTTIKMGQNVDGYGRVYLKMIDNDSYEIYKDEAMTMMVGQGDTTDTTGTVIEANNSGLTGLAMTFSSGLSAGMTSTIQLGALHEDGQNSIDFSDLEDSASPGTNAFFVASGSYFSGVNLGENTSDTGKLFIKADLSSTTDSTIYVYKDSRMRDEDLVAKSDDIDLSSTDGGAVRLYGVQIEGGASTGLYGTLNFDQVTQDLNIETSISFEELGLRVSAADYGSENFVSIDQTEGAVWSHYSEQDGAELLDAGLTGISWTEYGRDATITLNGQQVKLDGISGEVANLDTAATLVFREGGLGTTTIAAVGYDNGSWGARASRMYDDEDNYVNHALKSTTENLDSWVGGMQFQLGEGSGDQERTIFSLRDMTATELGRVKFTDSFDESSSLKSSKYLSINDLLSGGLASLGSDPVKSLDIIDQAIKDVSNLRAQIGAFQSNMLQTNANSLNVAIENITKTESYIRDADMAYETTQFSKNQIMVQAGTSMLAQANAQQQSVLSLIG